MPSDESTQQHQYHSFIRFRGTFVVVPLESSRRKCVAMNEEGNLIFSRLTLVGAFICYAINKTPQGYSLLIS